MDNPFGDLRRDFRTPEARKAGRDEFRQREEIRQKSRDQVAKDRADREAQAREREAQAIEN